MFTDDYLRDKIVSWRSVGLAYAVFASLVALVVSVQVLGGAASGSSEYTAIDAVQLHEIDAFSYLKEEGLIECPPFCR